jgi:hypothetical protein
MDNEFTDEEIIHFMINMGPQSRKMEGKELLFCLAKGDPYCKFEIG